MEFWVNDPSDFHAAWFDKTRILYIKKNLTEIKRKFKSKIHLFFNYNLSRKLFLFYMTEQY